MKPYVSPLPRLLLLAWLAWSTLPVPAAPAKNSAIVPKHRDAQWLERHEEFVRQARKGDIDLLFLGDSITYFWCDPARGKEVWDKNFGPLRAANFSIKGDRTQHLLWRLQNGEVAGIKPKVVVLLIGTNNTGKEDGSGKPRNSTAQAIEGVTAIVKELRSRLPESKLLLLAIFPRDTKDSPQRRQVAEVNLALKELHDGDHIHYLDIGGKFLDPDGNIPKEIMPDGLHPSKRGYKIWADAIREPLAALMKQAP